ncbi:MAG: serine/threonine protein kinase [Cyanobacteria bacterium SZAS-4]|nr:serine/threonine protein kinase [Cyanobacteria bacterium SZAS-4]
MAENDQKIQSLPRGEAVHTLVPGTIIDSKYKVISVLGTGGMGSVYQVQQLGLGKTFALKVLDAHKQSGVAVRRFQQEAKTAASLRHPNLVEVHDFGVFGDSQPYLVMEYVNGESLDKHLKVTRTLPVDYVISLAIQVGFGLMYAHSQGIVHRDIKPGNIIALHPDVLPAEGTVKVVDFGIAKLMQSEDGQIQELTRTGEIFGSPIYMSPEQCRGTAVDQRADIYSLGCVLYECLTGLPPFVGDTAMSTMVKRLTQAPASLKDATIGLDFPPGLEAVIRKMLAVEPEDRYQEFGSVIQDLMSLNDPDAVVPGTRPPQKPKATYLKELTLVSVTSTICFIATYLIDKQFFVPPLIEAEQKTEAKDPLGPTSAFAPISTAMEHPTRKVLGSGYKAKEFINFPSRAGSISIGVEQGRAAQGEFFIPGGDLVNLNLNEEAAAEPDFLSNLSDVKFGSLNFNSHVTVSNESLYMFQALKHVEHFGLSGCAINSLKPIYDATYVTTLDVTDTHVPLEELLKCKFFHNLAAFNFGPVRDPAPALKELTKNTQLYYLKYTGPLEWEHKTNARGLNKGDVQYLIKMSNLSGLWILNSPQFDDACLEQLLKGKKFKELMLKECGITAKSIALLKTAKLQNLKISTLGFSSREQKLLKALPYPVEFLESEKLREANKLKQSIEPSVGFFLDKYADEDNRRPGPDKTEQKTK